MTCHDFLHFISIRANSSSDSAIHLSSLKLTVRVWNMQTPKRKETRIPTIHFCLCVCYMVLVKRVTNPPFRTRPTLGGLQRSITISYLGGWQLKCCLFSPRTLGKMIQFDEHIFQRGWFNHQLVMNHEWSPGMILQASPIATRRVRVI